MTFLLNPLPYQVKLRDYLKAHEPNLWQWFSSAQARADHATLIRLDLLKTTYRLDRDDHAETYALLDEARALLGVDVPVTLYQAQSPGGTNAALIYGQSECHVMLEGNILALMSPDELRALFGHELSHARLWQVDDGEYFVADGVINAMAGDPRAASSHIESARLFRLFTEIYCDRGALAVTGDLDVALSSLIKAHTGVAAASSRSYLRQAEEIFAEGGVVTEGVSHPELFIRARALDLYSKSVATDHAETAGSPSPHEDQIAAMLMSAPSFATLDLMAQLRLSETTRRFVATFTEPEWLRTPPVLAHRRLFDDGSAAAPIPDAELVAELVAWGAGFADYFCYVLLDFATIDPDLEEAPLASATLFASRMGLAEPWEKLLAKELKMPKRAITRLAKDAEAIAKRASGSGRATA